MDRESRKDFDARKAGRFSRRELDAAAIIFGEDATKGIVQVLNQCRLRAEIRGERDKIGEKRIAARALKAELPPPGKEPGIGTPKKKDRLDWIADDKEGAASR